MDIAEVIGFSLGGAAPFVGVLLAILAVLWALLPLAVFGTQRKLKRLIAQTELANANLERVAEILARTEMQTSGAVNERAPLSNEVNFRSGPNEPTYNPDEDDDSPFN